MEGPQVIHTPASVPAGDGFISPFAIIDATGDAGATKAKITDYSLLYKSSDAEDTIDITSFDADFPVVDGDWAWLEVTIADRVPTTAILWMGQPSAYGWTDFPQAYDEPGSAQTKLFIPLARFETKDTDDLPVAVNLVGRGDDDSPALMAKQVVVTHLVIVPTYDGGRSFIGAVAYPGTETIAVFRNPFTVVDATEADTVVDGVTTAAPTQAKLTDVSLLIKATDDPTNTLDISAMNEASAVNAGDWAWLEVHIADGEATYANVRMGTPSGAGWTNFPQTYDAAGSAQTRLYIPIAQFQDVDLTDPVAVNLIGRGDLALRAQQYVVTHLVLVDIAIGDERIVSAVAWPGGDVPAVFASPFKIVDATADGDGSPTKASVRSYSLLFYASDDPTDNSTSGVEIGGLATDYDVATGDRAWLEVTLSGKQATAVNLRMGVPSTNGWTQFPQPYDHLGSAQTKAFILLAQFHDMEDADGNVVSVNVVGRGNDALRVVQYVVTHLLLADVASGSDSFVGAVAWPGSDAAPPFAHPFRILNATTGGTRKIKVAANSSLLRTIDYADTVDIDNLDTALAIAEHDFILLCYDPATDSASIVIQNTTFGSDKKAIEWIDASASEKVQKYAWVVIGRVVTSPVTDDVAAFTLPAAGEDVALDVVQQLFTALILAETCYGGQTVTYPAPWHCGELS